MSGVFGSLFRGEAGRSTDDSMRRWKQLFQADEQLDLQKKQMEQAVTMQEDQQDFQRELEQMRQDHQEGVLDRQQKLEVGTKALEFLPTVGYERAQEIIGNFEETGNPLVSVMRLAARQGLFQNPQDGVDLYNNFLNDPTLRPSWQSLEEAVRVTGQMAGTSEEDLEATIDELRTEWEARGEEQQEERDIQLDTARATLGQIEANVSHIGAQEEQTRRQTELIGAQTQRVFQQVEQSEELQPLVVENQRLQNLNLERDAERMQIEIDYLPEQITAGLSQMYAQTKDIENGNRLFEATYEDMVTKVAAEAQITQEEARHKVATGLWRDSIIKADLDQANATLDLMELEEESMGIQNERARLGLEGDELALTEQRLSMMNVLIERGQPELVNSLAPQLLEKVGISEEDRAEITEMAAEIAGQKRVTTADLERAQARIALAEADFQEQTLDARTRQQVTKAEYDEWKTSIAENQRKFDNRLNEQQADAYVNNLRNQRGMGEAEGEGFLAPNAAHNALQDAGQGSIEGIREEIRDYDAKAAELLRLRTLRGDFDAEGNPVPEGERERLQLPQTLANRIGDSPSNLDAEIAVLEQDLNSAESILVGSVHSYMSEYMSLTGQPLSPDTLGLTPSHSLYSAAFDRTPLGRYMGAEEEANQSVLDRTQQLINTIAVSADPISAHTGGTIAVYEELLEEFGEERLTEAGIEGPAQLTDAFTEKAQEAATHRDLGKEGISFLNGVLDSDYSFDVPGDRREATQALNNRARSVRDLSQEILQIGNTIEQTENQDFQELANAGLAPLDEAWQRMWAETGSPYDPFELAARIRTSTGLDASTLQSIGVIDASSGGVADLDAAYAGLQRYADRLANYSIGISYFDGR